MTTKESIIFESLKLFATQGFDAVSTRTIARAVGASDAVIYKHFKNKQEILDCIVKECLVRYKTMRDKVKLNEMNWQMVEEICLDIFDFQTSDEWITNFRQILIIEQFKNPEMQKLYKDFFINIPLDSLEAMFKTLISYGYVKENNPRIYAMQLYSPFFMYHTFGAGTDEVRELLKEYIALFRENAAVDKSILHTDKKGL